MNPERAARIQGLKNHPAWGDLKAEIEEAYERYTAAVTKTMMATGRPFPDFEYKRGYLKGMMEVIRLPDQAILAIEKDLKKHQTEQEESVEQ